MLDRQTDRQTDTHTHTHTQDFDSVKCPKGRSPETESGDMVTKGWGRVESDCGWAGGFFLG